MATNFGTEQGVTGVPSFNGREADRYLTELQGPEGIQTMARILRREPAAYTVQNAIRLAARQATWKTVPATDAPGDQRAAEFVDQCLEDMSHTLWSSLSFALSCQAFGFADLHVVYKRRSGSITNGSKPASLYNDGLVGIRKLAIRRQETIDSWERDENGGPQAMIQVDPSTGRRLPPVSIDRMLHFIGGDDRGSWEGIGWLEPAYKIWHMIQGFEIIYGIGAQRSFVGVPTFKYVNRPDAESIRMVREMGRKLTIGENQFIEYPGAVVEFSLQSVTNGNAGELREQIKELRWQMLMLGLVQFLQLGNSGSGSRALADPLITMFKSAIDAANDEVADVLNRHLIPRLFSLNPSLAKNITQLPKIVPSRVNALGSEVLSFLGGIQSFLVGAPNDDALWLRKIVGMPETEANSDPLGQPVTDPQSPMDTTGDLPVDASLSSPLSSRELARMRTATREFSKAADIFERVFYAQ
jgi:hypothetical protein